MEHSICLLPPLASYVASGDNARTWHRQNYTSTLHLGALIFGIINGGQQILPIPRIHRLQIIRRTALAVCLASQTTTAMPLALERIGGKALPWEGSMRILQLLWALRVTRLPRTHPWLPPPTRIICTVVPMSELDVRLI